MIEYKKLEMLCELPDVADEKLANQIVDQIRNMNIPDFVYTSNTNELLNKSKQSIESPWLFTDHYKRICF